MASPYPWSDARNRLMAEQQKGLLPPIEWPNETFTRPVAMPFLSVSMTGDAALPAELGPNPVWVEEGTLTVQLHIPRGQGTDMARNLAYRIVRLFRAVRGGPVKYRRTSIGSGERDPKDPQGNWWLLPVYVDFEFDDLPA